MAWNVINHTNRVLKGAFVLRFDQRLSQSVSRLQHGIDAIFLHNSSASLRCTRYLGDADGSFRFLLGLVCVLSFGLRALLLHY